MSAKLAKLPTFFTKPALERRLLLEAFFTLVRVRMGLWLLPYGVLLRFVKRPVQRTANVEVSQVTRSLASASRFVPRATCLAQALAGQRLLAAHGYSSRLRIGVRKDGARLGAHAWLEHQDRVVVGLVSNLTDYHPLSGERERP